MLDNCDFLAVLPGWKNSSGTKEEIAMAEKTGKKVFYLDKTSALEDILESLER
ncbi:DUF1937 family protein [Candidatus Nomurabacteria bacterium]|nr:DUF1937 family protein [Candidatus Nomurabacteria bacterium]